MIRGITHITAKELSWFIREASVLHHFFIDCDREDYVKIKLWCADNAADGYQVYPEMITDETLTSSVERIHVTFNSDRDATIFKLSW